VLAPGGHANPVNCRSYEYWYGAKRTAVTTKWQVLQCNGAQVFGMSACMYQAIGLDAFVGTDDKMYCVRP
jgi:hypothetical protein